MAGEEVGVGSPRPVRAGNNDSGSSLSDSCDTRRLPVNTRRGRRGMIVGRRM